MKPLTLLATLLLALSILSGCLGLPTENEDEGDEEGTTPPAPIVRVGSEQKSEQLSAPAVHPQREAVGQGWTVETPANLLWLRLELQWTQAQNRFGLLVDGPGEPQSFAPPAQEATVLQAEPSDLAGGRYAIRATGEGVLLPDTLKLNATYTWLTEPGIVDWVQVRQVGSSWEASITYQANQTAGAAVDLEIDTFNGAVEISGTDQGPAVVQLEAWARAASREAAIASVKAIDVRLCICDSRVVATAEAPDGQNRGAHVRADLPADVSGGVVDTSNGPIDLAGVSSRDSSFDSSNGPIRGSVEVAGSFAADTSNGPIDLSLTPTASASLALGSSNGPITLRLKEGPTLAYDLDAHTSNGDIAEDMDEASLEGDEDDATLTTAGGSGRSIQVTGTVETSNADVRFEGA